MVVIRGRLTPELGAVVQLAAAGIRIGPHTATPEWNGEQLDLGWALDVLRDDAAQIG